MSKRVRWGVLGVAKIALDKVVPAMQQGEWSEVTAIASRDLRKAQAAARQLGIARAYGSYEELLADTEIEAIYNPLPNHLHVSWSIKAAAAGKSERRFSHLISICPQEGGSKERPILCYCREIFNARAIY